MIIIVLLSILIAALLYRRFIVKKSFHTLLSPITFTVYAQDEVIKTKPKDRSLDELNPFGFYFQKTILNYSCPKSLSKDILFNPQMILDFNQKNKIKAQKLIRELRNQELNFWNSIVIAAIYFQTGNKALGKSYLIEQIQNGLTPFYYGPCILSANEYLDHKELIIKNYKIILNQVLTHLDSDEFKKIIHVFLLNFKSEFHLTDEIKKLSYSETEDILKKNKFGKEFFTLWLKQASISDEQRVHLINQYISVPILEKNILDSVQFFSELLPPSERMRNVVMKHTISAMEGKDLEKKEIMVHLFENRNFKESYFSKIDKKTKHVSNLKRNLYLELLAKKQGCQFAYKNLMDLGEDLSQIHESYVHCVRSGF